MYVGIVVFLIVGVYLVLARLTVWIMDLGQAITTHAGYTEPPAWLTWPLDNPIEPWPTLPVPFPEGHLHLANHIIWPVLAGVAAALAAGYAARRRRKERGFAVEVTCDE